MENLNEEVKPSFWAVIPATVRYSDKIGSTAKLIYAEVTALSNTQGYCWAPNSYFAKLFRISIEQVSRLISDLCREGFLKSFVDNENRRKLYPQVSIDSQSVLEINGKTLAGKFDEQVGPVASELEEEKKAFLEYWTAKNDGGKKEHWQKQTTFSVLQRWNTWIKNKRKWEKPGKPLPSDDELRKQLEKEQKIKDEEAKRKAELDKVGKPRTPEEQARLNESLAKLRAELSNKFAL